MTVSLNNSFGIVDRFSTLIDLLSYRARTQPNQIAYTFLQDGETESNWLTYQELDRQARSIAAQLQRQTVIGSRALMLYPSGLEVITAFFGCLYAGIVAVPAYPPRRNQKMSRLEAIVENAQATVVLTTRAVLVNIERRFAENPSWAEMSWLVTDNLNDDLASDWYEPAVSCDTLAFLQYTSGSTGAPKGVMISHGNLLHNEEMIKIAYQHTEKTIFVGWLPLFHDMGLIGNVLQPLYLGIPCFLMSPEDFLKKPIRWLKAISRYKATTSGGPNFAYDLCVRKVTPEHLASIDLSSWQVAFNGAEPVRSDTLEQFTATFSPCGFRREAFYPCYGMAETTLFVSGGLPTDPPIIRGFEGVPLEQNQVIITTDEQKLIRKIVSCGQAWLDEKILIADPHSLTLCETNQVGEIWVAGSHVAQGYWNRSKETEQTYRAYLADTGEGPFLRTGDLGFIYDGELFVTGRLKDVIIIRGRNHYPQDIELTVETSDQALRPGSGAAFAVTVKGIERLVVVQEVERTYLRKLDLSQVVSNIRRAVTAEHSLQLYAIVLLKTGSIPKTSSGKIRRHACRAGFFTGSLDFVGDWCENPQNKMNFLSLQAKVESVFKEVVLQGKRT
ncbi:MAG: fatty acyl-AMP ligase [Cyanobacteria bacterium P01_G01_bin.67]